MRGDTHQTSHARTRTPLHDCFGFGGAGLRRLERRYALRCPLPSRRRSQASSAALHYVGHNNNSDTYDSLEWEKKDNEDEDAEVIGACDSDKDEEEEAGEASADDTADVSDSEAVLLTEEQKIEMRKSLSHGECLSIRKGWRILSKDEGIARIQAVGRKKSTRTWKLVHLWDVEGWLEGAVVRRIGRKYETRYPGERPVDHDLRSEEYGPGGWTDAQQQIWIVIVKDCS